MKTSKRTLAFLIIFCFFISFITPFVDFTKLNFGRNVKASTNYLFKDVTYNLTLDDVYDDADAYKVYTSSYFQSQYFNMSTLAWDDKHNETVDSGVDNNEVQLGDPSHITMIQGTTGSEDEMDILDTVCTTFDSTDYGNYPATYSFTNDGVGDDPTGWITTEPADINIEVVAGEDGHRKVIELYDGSGINAWELKNAFSGNQESGTIEFWVKTTDATYTTWFQVRDSGDNIRIYMGIDADVFKCYGPTTTLQAILNNVWYHIRIDFECGAGGYEGLDADKYNLYIDDTLYANKPFYAVATNLYYFDVSSRSNHNGYYSYIDAVGYSWDGSYNIGDNLVAPSAESEFTILTPFTNYNLDLLSIHTESHQKTNISQQIYFKIWNYDSSSYETITSATETTSITERDFNSASPEDYISGSGVKLYWQGENSDADFLFSIDYLLIQICYKMNIWHEVSFDTNGLWRYRWELHGSLSYTSWTQFEVVDPEPNFHAINEADNPTKWVLHGSDDIAFENFSDDISGSNWDLSGVANRFFDKNTIQSVNYLLTNSTTSSTWGYSGINFYMGSQDALPTGITYDGTYFWVVGANNERAYKYTSVGVYTGTSFSLEGLKSALEGITWDGTYFWVLGVEEGTVVKLTSVGGWTGTYFSVSGQCSDPTGIAWDGTYLYVIDDEEEEVFKYTSAGTYTGTHWDVITQDNTPSDIAWDGTYFWVLGNQHDEVYKYNSVGTYTGTHFDTGVQDPQPQGICFDGTYFWIVGENSHRVFKYELLTTISKNYLGSGYTYMQTSITETMALLSTDYGATYSLNSKDYFEVDFQTSSDSLINLQLYKSGNLQKTLTLSPSENTNFNRHTAKIIISENMEFDQLKISSMFEDKDYYKMYDIKTYKYSEVGFEKEFQVGSHSTYSIYLVSDTYNLGISEGTYNRELDEWDWGSEKYNKNITIDSTDYYQIYQPAEYIQCRLGLFSVADPFRSLVFTDYHIEINRSLDGEYQDPFTLLDNLFYADINTNVYINVSDRFGNLIDPFTRSVSSFIDLDLHVYQLEIINLMLQKTTVDINNHSCEYQLASGRWLDFMLAENDYWVGYFDSNNIYQHIIIHLDSNLVVELNMSRICNLYYTNQKGEYLEFHQFKTYVNGTLLLQNVFYATDGEHKGIEVKDRYDISIKNETYVEGTELYNQISIILTYYSLKVYNQQLAVNHINITRDPIDYPGNPYFWSDGLLPGEIIKFNLFPGNYKINLTNYEAGSSSYYSYTLNGDDVLMITSSNTIYNVLLNLANVNTTIGNQITMVEINITNQNSAINNSIVYLNINLGNVNSTLGNMLVALNVNITNLQSDINALYLFTNTSIFNLNSAMNTSFIYMENNLYSINQSISTLVIGIDNQISLLNATINVVFTEMNQQFIVTQTTLNYSFAFLNQSVIQLANDIVDNQVILYNLIEQRANDIDSSLIDIQTLINLVNNSVVDESLVIQTLINLIGANITNNHIAINNLLNLIDNNITNNNIQLVSILELIGNNITTNHFVIQNLLDVIGNNITFNHIELLTNLNLINTTISQNQIELINRLLFINNTMNDVLFELTNQLLFLNGTIYSAVLNLSTSVEFGTDMVLGNISITYQQNEFLTELYKRTMFSQLLNWSGAAYNYSVMEDRIDVWEFINNYRNQSITVFLRYGDLVDNLTITAQNTLLQYLPKTGTEYRLWSETEQRYLDDWQPLPDNKTVDFGFYETEVPIIPDFNEEISDWILAFLIIGIITVILAYGIIRTRKKSEKRRDVREMLTAPTDTDIIKKKKRTNKSSKTQYETALK